MKKCLALLLTVFMVFSVAACGSGGKKAETIQEDQSTGVSGETQQSGEDSTSSDSSQSQVKRYKGEIVVSIGQNPKDSEGAQAMIAAYNKLQPDVKVIWEPKEGADYPTWLGTQLASGNIRPDIVMGNYQPTYAKYVNFDKYRYTVNPYTGNKWDEDLDWDFFVAKNSAGSRIMLPTQAVHIMWFYNKDLFDKAGVTPPKDWDEMVKVCEKLESAGVTPIASNFIWKAPQWLQEIYLDQYTRPWHEFSRAQPGDFNYSEDLDGKFVNDPNDPYIDLKYTYSPQRYYKAIKEKNIRFDTPEMADFVSNMAKVFPKYCTSDFFVMQDDYPVFLQQKVAMIVDGTWSLPTLTQDMANLGDKERLKTLKIDENTKLTPFNWGTFETPPLKSSLTNGPIRSIESASGEYLSIIDKNQEQTDMCLDFLMFWTCKAGYQPYVDGQVAAKKFKPAGPIMVKGVTVPNDIQEMFGGIKMMGNAEILMNQVFTNTVGGAAGYQKQVFDMYKQALEGKISPEEFAKQLQKLVDDNFDDILKTVGLSQDAIAHPEKSPN